MKGIEKMPLQRIKEAKQYKYLDKFIEENPNLEGQLHETPELDIHLIELLEVAKSLKELKSVHAPDSMTEKSFIINKVSRLNMSKSEIDPRIKNHHKFAFSSFRLATVVSLFLILVIICSLWVNSVSAKSLPGTFLYPLKISIEDWKLKTANSEIEKVNLYILIANRRLDEANSLLIKGDIVNSVSVMEKYNDQIKNINTVLDNTVDTSIEEHLHIFKLVNLWLPKQIFILDNMLGRYSDPEQKRIIENSFNVTRISHDRIVQLWNIFQSSDSFTNYEKNINNLAESKELGYIETRVLPTNQLDLVLTNTPKGEIKSLENSKTPTADKDRPLYNKSMTKTPTLKPSEVILPTEMPTPRRTPQPLFRLPTKNIPTAVYPTNRPHENPTRTPVLP